MMSGSVDKSAEPTETSRWDASTIVPALAFALATLLALLVYSGAVAVAGPEHPLRFLEHLSVTKIPPERLLTGGLGLALLLALVGAPTLAAWFKARRLGWLKLGLTLLVAGTLFWLFRDRTYQAGDSPSLLRDPVGSIRRGTPYTFLDELLGLWLPLKVARLFYLMDAHEVRAIKSGYRLVSITCGLIYVAMVAWAAGRLKRPLCFSTLFLGGAATLHFCGYLENYQAAVMLLSIGFLLATDALRRREPSWKVVTLTNLCFTLAVAFHGVSGYGVLALGWLALLSARGSLRRLLVIVASNLLLSAALLGGIYLLFANFLAPGVGLIHVKGSSYLTSIDAMLAHRPFADHLLMLLRVGFPALLAILTAAPVALIKSRRIRPASDLVFALLFLIGFLVHQAVWRSGLGSWRDWDLFGFTFLPLAYLGWRSLEAARARDLVAIPLFFATLLTGFSWVLLFARPW